MEQKNEIISPFEASKDAPNLKLKNKKIKDSEETMEDASNKSDVFAELLQDGEKLDKSSNRMVDKISIIISSHKKEFEKNFTFGLIFESIELLLEEYKSQTLLFKSYAASQYEMYNEESLVRLLDILREITKERKTIINDIVDKVIKVQKLSNDRLKIDMGTDGDDIKDLFDPDEIK